MFSKGINIHGDGVIVRYNHIEEALGAGIRLRATKDVDGRDYGFNNQVFESNMFGYRSKYASASNRKPKNHDDIFCSGLFLD